MIERFFRLINRLAYGGFKKEEGKRQKEAAEAYRRMKARCDAEFERLVLTGRR